MAKDLQDRPVEVRIEDWRGCDESSCSSDDFKGEHLVCSHSIQLHEGRVASTLNVTTNHTHGLFWQQM